MARAKEHLEALLSLPPAERSAAAEALFASLEEAATAATDEIQRAWVDEIEARMNFGAAGIAADEIFAEGRARLRDA